MRLTSKSLRGAIAALLASGSFVAGAGLPASAQEPAKDGVTLPPGFSATVFADPHLAVRGVCQDVEHPAAKGKPVRLLKSSIRISGHDLGVRRPPPMLGEHTDEVLARDLGYHAFKIAALRDKGVTPGASTTLPERAVAVTREVDGVAAGGGAAGVAAAPPREPR